MSNLSKFIMLMCIGLVLATVTIWLIGGKKKEFDSTVSINARASQIFPYLIEPDLKKEWMQGFREQELFGELPIVAGSELQTVLESNGDTIQTRDLVIRLAENEMVSIKSDSPKKQLTSIFRLKEARPITRVEYRLIVRSNGLDRFTSVFSNNGYREEIENDLNRLAKLVESEYPDGWDDNLDSSTTAGVDTSANGNSAAPRTSTDADDSNDFGGR